VVAMAAPQVEQPDPLARRPVEQPRRQRESPAVAGHRRARFLDQFLALAPAAALPERRPQDARRRKQARTAIAEVADGHYELSAIIPPNPPASARRSPWRRR